MDEQAIEALLEDFDVALRSRMQKAAIRHLDSVWMAMEAATDGRGGKPAFVAYMAQLHRLTEDALTKGF